MYLISMVYLNLLFVGSFSLIPSLLIIPADVNNDGDQDKENNLNSYQNNMDNSVHKVRIMRPSLRSDVRTRTTTTLSSDMYHNAGMTSSNGGTGGSAVDMSVNNQLNHIYSELQLRLKLREFHISGNSNNKHYVAKCGGQANDFITWRFDSNGRCIIVVRTKRNTTSLYTKIFAICALVVIFVWRTVCICQSRPGNPSQEASRPTQLMREHVILQSLSPPLSSTRTQLHQQVREPLITPTHVPRNHFAKNNTNSLLNYDQVMKNDLPTYDEAIGNPSIQ